MAFGVTGGGAAAAAPEPGVTLVTGASGLIGSALVGSLAASRPVLAMSRRAPAPGIPAVRADFTDAAGLTALEGRRIDAAVHLAAVTGGCSEEDGLRVNVAGTARLLRHLAAAGCRRFVLASSIAAVGLADPGFRPVALPMPDDHPCLARDAYGLSKYVMEEVAAYFARRHPDVEVLCLRLPSISADDRLPAPRSAGPLGAWALAAITVMALSDAVRLLTRVLDAPPRPGFRRRNAAPARAWVAEPTAALLERWYGDSVDLAAYRRPGHSWDSVFDSGRLAAEVGFAARVQAPAGPGAE